MNRRVAAFLLACTAVPLAVGHATAQEPARAPAGDFALSASTAAGDVLGVLRVVPRGDGWNARLVASGQPEVVLDSAVWLAPRLTLRTSSGEPIVLELRFEGDSALSGTFVAGEATGTLRGRRRSPVLHVGRSPGSDPDSARLIDRDVRLFWGILDRSTPESLVELPSESISKEGPTRSGTSSRTGS